MKYCSLFNYEVLETISQNCNPFYLSELYLDGCDGVNDDLFDCVILSKEEKELKIKYAAFFNGKGKVKAEE